MSLTAEEWEEYREYLTELTDEELEVELEWLETIGKAKKEAVQLFKINLIMKCE